jgi:GMP reductase
LRIEEDIKLDFKDVLIRPKRSTLSSRKEVNLERTYKFKHSDKIWRGVPIIASNMDGVGTFSMAEALAEHKAITCLTKDLTKPNIEQLIRKIGASYFAVSTGITDKDTSNLVGVLGIFPSIEFICIDVANGYSDRFGDYVATIRKMFPDKIIIAGNVVTADMTQELILRGADIVKVGIGPGSVCTTRIQTGVGYPQLSAIIECADAAHGLGAHIIADGGCTCPGDVAKAFGAGADFVMLGSMLAGTDQGGGEIIENEQGQKLIKFYGMSSQTANEKHFGGLKDYRSSEGRTVLIPYKGDINSVIQDILGGIRSTCSYVGAPSLKQLSKCTTFIRCTQTHNTIYEKNTIGR